MNSKNLYIIRHGETDFNKRGIVQGSGIDSSLNERGREQARKFYNRYRNYPFDKIYLSTLKRTWETVEEFLNDGILSEKLSGLNEINWGHREGKAPTRMDQAYYREVTSKWRNGKTGHTIEGGESPEDVRDRLRPALEKITSGIHKNMLICTHGRAMRILMTMLFNYPLSSMDYFPHRNVCLYHVVFTGQLFSLAGYQDGSNHK